MKNLSTAYLAFLILTTSFLAGFSIATTFKNPSKEFQKVSYVWCKVGQDPKKNHCVDGSGSGG